MKPQTNQPTAQEAPLTRAILHFETFGTVSYVLSDIDAHVPDIFADTERKLTTLLSEHVSLYASNNKWDVVSLRVSRGMARYEMNDLMENWITHTGPIMIDPTGSTPEHQTYNSGSELQSGRDRLIRVNEATGDLLIIMYGLDGIDRPVSAELAMRRLRLVNASLDLLATDIGGTSGGSLRHRLLSEGQRLAALALQKQGYILKGNEDVELRSLIDPEGNMLQAELLSLFAIIHTLHLDASRDPLFKQSLEAMMVDMSVLQTTLKEMGLSFRPHEEAVLELRQRTDNIRKRQKGLEPVDQTKVDKGRKMKQTAAAPRLNPK